MISDRSKSNLANHLRVKCCSPIMFIVGTKAEALDEFGVWAAYIIKKNSGMNALRYLFAVGALSETEW